MLSNPPYGKSWKVDAEKMGGKKEILDTRFNVYLEGGEQMAMIPRTSDGQLLFLLNNVAKMKKDTPLGSRIAEVHNGSSIFTGDAAAMKSPLRKNMGKKNCEITSEIRSEIVRIFTEMEQSEVSMIFDNEEFGYWSVTVERPLRLRIYPDRENPALHYGERLVCTGH